MMGVCGPPVVVPLFMNYLRRLLTTRQSQLETKATCACCRRREDVRVHPKGPWKVRESAAGSLQFADVPDGFFSAAVVPYSTAGPRPSLFKDCALYHLPNKYCARQTAARRNGTSALFCTEPFRGFISR